MAYLTVLLILPEDGILSFFYDLETMTWGFDPEDKGSAQVFYFPKDTALRAADIPEELDEEFVIPEMAVNFEPHVSLPGYGDKDDELGLSRDEDLDWDEFDECRKNAGGDDKEELTKLFGYPDVIQNPMEEECEACSRGFRQGNSEDYAAITDAEKADIAEKAKDWVLLFQMSLEIAVRSISGSVRKTSGSADSTRHGLSYSASDKKRDSAFVGINQSV